jgi:Holliday junction resolvasome RuvABC endonuclease subunit
LTAVVGLDLSLTSSGLARITWGRDKTTVIETTTRGEAGVTTLADPAERCHALHRLKTAIVDWASPADLVVVESMVPNPMSRSTNERGALWYLIVLSLLHRELDVRFVHPGTLKRYATGRGGADKAAMKAATTEAFPAVRTRTDDERDALWLAAVGVHLLDGPLPYPVSPEQTGIVAKLNAASVSAA